MTEESTFTCELCRCMKVPTKVGVTVAVSDTFGPGKGEKTLCPRCYTMLGVAILFRFDTQVRLDADDTRGSSLELLLKIREHFEECWWVKDLEWNQELWEEFLNE